MCWFLRSLLRRDRLWSKVRLSKFRRSCCLTHLIQVGWGLSICKGSGGGWLSFPICLFGLCAL